MSEARPQHNETKDAQVRWVIQAMRKASSPQCRFSEHLLCFDLNDEWRFTFQNPDAVTIVPAWAETA